MSGRFIASVVLAAGLLGGCGSARPSKYYELTIPGNSAAAPDAAVYPVRLLIGPMHASHLYREDRIVYSSHAEEMGTYDYHRWAVPPAEMLEDVLLRNLRSSGRFRDVDIERSNSRGDYVLTGHLYDFEEISAAPLMARLTMDLQLRETRTGSTVWTHYYSYDESVEGKDVNAVVAALDKNAQKCMNEVKASLEEYFAAHPLNP